MFYEGCVNSSVSMEISEQGLRGLIPVPLCEQRYKVPSEYNQKLPKESDLSL